MATSGSSDFNRTRNEIILHGLRIVGVLEQGENPTPEQLTEGADVLELVLKSFSNKVFPYWALIEKTEALNTPSSEVTGTDGNIYTCILTHTSTTDDEPITGKNFTNNWRLRGTTGGVWADATIYGNIGEFLPGAEVLSVSKAFIRRITGFDQDMRIVTRSEYFERTIDKFPPGLPSELIFEVGLIPRIIIYPVPEILTDVLHYLAWVKLQDFDEAGNNPDVKAAWLLALTYQFAAIAVDEYHTPLPERAVIKAEAARLLAEAKQSNIEPNSGQTIQPAYSSRGRRFRRRYT